MEPDVLSNRPLREADLPEVDRIFRLAFGTFIGYPDPLSFAAGHTIQIGPRFRHNPDGMFVAEVGGRLAGSAIANRWGSVGFFGPLTVHPEFWDRKLVQPPPRMEPLHGHLHALGLARTSPSSHL